MFLWYLINSLVVLGILILSSSKYLKFSKDKNLKKINKYSTAIIIIIYIIFLTLSSLWITGILEYSNQDFSIISAFLIFFQTVALFNLVYLFSHNKKIFYLLLFYLIPIAGAFLNLDSPRLAIIMSMFLTLVVFLKFIPSKYYKIGYFAVFYSSISLILQLILFYNPNLIYQFSIFSNFLFLGFLWIIFKELENKPFATELKKEKKSIWVIDFLRYFIFLVVITNFILIGTITIHELGHLTTSGFYGCEYRRIVYDEGIPRTEILCKDAVDESVVLLGGILSPILIALLLFLAGGKTTKEIALLMAGFNLIISHKDYIDLNLSDNIAITLVIIGVASVILGIVTLAKSRVGQDFGLD